MNPPRDGPTDKRIEPRDGMDNVVELIGAIVNIPPTFWAGLGVSPIAVAKSKWKAFFPGEICAKHIRGITAIRDSFDMMLAHRIIFGHSQRIVQGVASWVPKHLMQHPPSSVSLIGQGPEEMGYPLRKLPLFFTGPLSANRPDTRARADGGRKNMVRCGLPFNSRIRRRRGILCRQQ